MEAIQLTTVRRDPDSHNTANLHLAGETDNDRASVSIENTADLSDALLDDNSGQSADSIAERYSEGIIRFYRARTILARAGGANDWQKAWSYLRVLEPQHVPPVARPAFFSLAYLMHEMAHADEFDSAEFCRQVNGIAVIIDGFLDDLESPEA